MLIKLNLALFTSAVLISITCCVKKDSSVTEDIPKAVFVSGPNDSPFKNHLGINGFEWDFMDDGVINPAKMEVIRSFGVFRHYLDWEKLEQQEGQYTFNPTHSGGWNYDLMYEQCKANGIDVLACIKVAPPWLVNTYPEGKRDQDNVPAPYGLDRNEPASYIAQAKVAFQFAARYGHNAAVDPALVKVNTKPRWNEDPANEVKIGLGLINYIECDNERDKTWKGELAYQNPEEYAANMSAFYDGNMGKMGKDAGIKTADPTMKVVMGGLSSGDVSYVTRMIEWCKKNRGYKADGTVNLCFDVINYHLYSNDWVDGKGATVGLAPEVSKSAEVADKYVAVAKEYANNTEVWITESGFDINPASPQRAIAIGNKSALITQADWMLRSAFLYVRHGLKRSYFYMLDDVNPASPIQYSSSGFQENNKRRPVADYFYQTKKLMGDFHYTETLNADPIVDVYSLDKRKIYIVFVPDQKGRTATYTLDLGSDVNSAKVYTLEPGATEMSVKTVDAKNGKLNLTATETPIFVEKI